MERSRVEDPYNLEHVVEKAVELASSKTIVRAMQHGAALKGAKGGLAATSKM